MPIIKSAKKRVRTAEKAAIRNSKTKRSLKNAVKAFQTAVESGNKAKVTKTLSEAQSAIDIAAKKNIIHKNKAARKKSQLVQKARAAGVKPAAKKTTAKKPASKSPAKKPAAKKPAAKK